MNSVQGLTGDQSVRVVAVDLGASSGRVLAVEVGPEILQVEEVHRFANRAVPIRGRLYWDVIRLFDEIMAGLREAAASGRVNAIGIDSWAVDYGLLDADGELLANPVSYRDDRTIGVPEQIWQRVPPAELYAVTGIQHQRFNTIFQLDANRRSAPFAAASSIALIPDLLAYWLTGHLVAEITNASTTQLVDVVARTWSRGLIEKIGLEPELLPQIVEPGTPIGAVSEDVAASTGLAAGTQVIAVGSHDTASAVVAVPATNATFAYISCGTWSLVGLELDHPVLTEESRQANCTNELGVDRTVRYLRNVMGFWLLQECQRAWSADGLDTPLEELMAAAAELPPSPVLIDADDPRFLPPGGMPQRIADAIREGGGAPPASAPQVVRCILDSLAESFARAIATASRLAGTPVSVIHIVGGGSRNELLCRLTAERTGIPVIAGPTEATGIGNALIQARALGAISGALPDLRALIARTQNLRRYEAAPVKSPATLGHDRKTHS